MATDDRPLKELLVNTLARWARAGALLQSVSCVSGGVLNTKGKCSEWRNPEGTDLSGMNDATFTTFIGAGLVRAYFATLADFDRERLKEQHKTIKGWINQWSARLKTPGDVYFGLNMGWYWPAIINDLVAGRVDQARKRLAGLDAGLTRLINDDGSIVDRTTRGDRALWYHYISVGEIVMSMELMRAAGMVPSQKLETKTHAAVDLFLRAVKDNAILDKWAQKRRNSRYDGKQDWSYTWPDHNFAGTWLHVYPYRYAGTANAELLRQKVRTNAKSAVSGIDLGIGLGCLYNVAATVR